MQKKNTLFAHPVSYILFAIYSLPLIASSEFTPQIMIKQDLVSNATATLDENGQTTTIAPGFRYRNTQRRSQLDVNYGYMAQFYSGLSSEDTEHHNLSLLYDFTHIPDHWKTQFNGNVRQISSGADGIQSFNQVLNSGNTKELKTYGIVTTIDNEFKQTLNLETQLLADFADFENAENTDSVGLKLVLDNKASQQKLYWNTSLSHRQSNSGEDTTQLNILELGLNYRFNMHYTGYINTQMYDTDNEVLNEASTLLGLNWQPDKNNSINAGFGFRGDTTQYSLSSKHTRKRLSLSVNYSENITSARSELLQQGADESEIINTFQTLSITPVLQKKGVINLTLIGRKTDVSIAFSSQKRSISNSTSEDEQTDALSLSLARRLSIKSTTTFRYQLQKSKRAEQNDITYVQLAYNRTISKNINMTALLSDSRQQSDRVENEYIQKILGISLTATF
ncbi:MAG: hypothetical protein H8E09_01120 [Gammaproteobacteria bacterium]|nr:hypothetical protein [Gammaproteobacteria bacterium]MBL7003822.1 hypothetical protein [Gammaproteobacteria bacterium]